MEKKSDSKQLSQQKTNQAATVQQKTEEPSPRATQEPAKGEITVKLFFSEHSEL